MSNLKILRGGKCEELIKLVRSIDNNREYVKSIGKKTHQADDNIMKEAERLLNEEFATILDISLMKLVHIFQVIYLNKVF